MCLISCLKLNKTTDGVCHQWQMECAKSNPVARINVGTFLQTTDKLYVSTSCFTFQFYVVSTLDLWSGYEVRKNPNKVLDQEIMLRLKTLRFVAMNPAEKCSDILLKISCFVAMNPAEKCGVFVWLSVHHFGPGRNISTSTGLIDMELSADIHGGQRVNHYDFSRNSFQSLTLHKCLCVHNNQSVAVDS